MHHADYLNDHLPKNATITNSEKEVAVLMALSRYTELVGRFVAQHAAAGANVAR